jgi:hypothetical protein
MLFYDMEIVMMLLEEEVGRQIIDVERGIHSDCSIIQ